jgi:hypothetical protein
MDCAPELRGASTAYIFTSVTYLLQVSFNNPSLPTKKLVSRVVYRFFYTLGLTL